MTKNLRLLLLLFLFALPAYAQTGPGNVQPDVPGGVGNLQNAVAANGNGSAVNVQGFGAAIIVVTIAGTGTPVVSFKSRALSSGSYTARYGYLKTDSTKTLVATTSTSGEYYIDCAGDYDVQAPVSGTWSGTVTATIKRVPATARVGAPSGGGSVLSVSNSDGTLAVSPTTGAVVASIDLTHSNTWLAAQTIQPSAADALPLQLVETSSMTNAIADPLLLRTTISGTPVAGFGTGISFRAKSATQNNRIQGEVGTAWTTATDATRTADLIFSTVNAGTLAEAGRFTGAGNLTVVGGVGIGGGSAINNSGPGGTLTALAFTSPGTGVATALGVNVGSAGAVVVNGGALGTPSNGVATNLTGLPLTTGVTGILPGANGGTGVANTGLTLNFGPGGTLGSNAFTSTAYMPLAGGTFTGDVTHSGAAIIISGNISTAAWTTNGVRIKGTPGTMTDTTSSGTVATAYTDVLGGNTIAASSATTFTNYFTQYNKDPIAGTNVTLTNKWALGGDSLKVGTSNPLTVSNAGVLNATSPVFVTPTLGAALATSINGNTFTTGTYTLTGTAGKTLNFTNSITLAAGADGTTQTFPTTSATIARTDAGQTFTGTQAFGAVTASTIGTTDKVTITQATAGNGLILSTGGSNTGSNATSAVDLSWTLNTSGSPDVFALRVTDTARGASTALMNLYAGASGTTSMFKVDRSGNLTIGSAINGASGASLFLSPASGQNLVLNPSGGGQISATAGQLNTGVISNTSTTDSTTTTSGALQVAGGAAIRKRVFIDGITASSGLQTAVLCQSSGGEMIADSVACLASSGRFKQDVRPLVVGLDEVMKLRPVSYRYKPEGIFARNLNFQRERVGFIAEDIDRVDSRLVGYEADGKTPRTVGYDQITPILVKSIQELKGEVDALKAEIQSLKQPRRVAFHLPSVIGL